MTQQTVSKMERVQTAVEWLKSKVLYIVPSSQKDDLLRLFEQAKQTEKEQISKAWIDGRKDGYQHIDIEYGNQYYNETYNK